MDNYVIIMAGGVGSRFWPASKESNPKQFLDILGTGKSLIRMTYERFINVIPKENFLVITNAAYRDLVLEHLPELSEDQVVGEPSRNNTAPCVAYASFKILHKNRNANLLVSPSDHFIDDEEEFVRVVKRGFEFTANNDVILTLGMTPTRPDTGYGYIQLDDELGASIFSTLRFTEKPDHSTAIDFIEDGNYCWNSGMFFFKAQIIIEDFKRHAVKIYDLLNFEPESYNSDREPELINMYYPQTPNISIDYAIMERVDHVCCLRADFGWSDLGTWDSLYDFLDDADTDNVTIGRVDTSDCPSSLIKSGGKQIIVKGLHNFLIVEADDKIVIWPRDDVKSLYETRDRIEGEK